MHQVLFKIPIRVFDWLPGWLPSEIPIYGFGAMLFLAFILCTWLAGWRAAKVGIAREYVQDVAVWIFLAGILGARITYVVVEPVPLSQFFVIWRGGLVFLGSFVGGLIGYGLWRAWLEGREVLVASKRVVFTWIVSGMAAAALIHVAYVWVNDQQPKAEQGQPWPLSFAVVAGGVAGLALAYVISIQKNAPLNWKFMDVLTPSIALGLALGRVGCLLNGCCYGNVACAQCPAIHFPLSAPPRFTYTLKGQQTSTGFTLAPTDAGDPRTRVGVVEPGSPAEASGLLPGDRIVAMKDPQGRVVDNQIVVDVGVDESRAAGRGVMKYLREHDRNFELLAPGLARVLYDDPAAYQKDLEYYRAEQGHGLTVATPTDLFLDTLVHNWPHGETQLALTVVHSGQPDSVELPPFAPVTIGLHPTQVYESISALLILFLLTAYYPLRRHDGEVFALFMLCYSVHRFLNEMLRNDTNPVLGTKMTFSQNGSILVFTAAVVLLVWLWRKPADYPATPAMAAA